MRESRENVGRTPFYTPQEAESAFYRAFQRRDVNAMMAVWSDDTDIVCVHPGGPMLIGRDAVRASWEEIFRRAPEMQFTVAESHRTASAALALHVVQEHIRVGSDNAPAPVLVTNAYRLTDTGWRMILHHASPAPTPAPGDRPATLH